MTMEGAGPIDEERLQLVMDAAGLDLWENDLASGRVTRKAVKIFAQLGYTPDEALDYIDDLFLIVHPDDVARIQAALASHLDGAAPHYACEFRLRSRAGAWVWYANHGKLIGTDGGQRLVGVTYNIDERHRRHEQSQEQQRRLVESELRHRDLLRNLHTAIVVHAPDTRIVYSNPRAAELLGLSEAQIEGKAAPDPAWCFTDERGATLALADYPVNRVIASGQPLEAKVLGVRRAGQASPAWLLVHAFPERDEDGALKQVVVNFDDISPRKEAEEKIHHLAFYDALTGLANRRLLLDRMHAALAASGRSTLFGALLFIDLDKFKTINDVLGHGVGDLMLVEVAARILGCVRESDTVARLGGDEFVVLMTEIDADPDTASRKTAHVAEKIRLALGAPYQLQGSALHTSPSIGASLFQGSADSADALLRQADMAMYKAKDAGRNTLRFFSPAMQLAVETRAALEADLRQAIGRGQLQLHWQVQVDQHQHACGAEALLRWHHPERGPVSPLQFIPIAEESSLILEIGNWVLETALAQLVAWQALPAMRNLTLAVNVSAQQFRQPDFVAQLAAAIARHGCDVTRLKLELTETVVLGDVDEVVARMHALRALGLALSMDDFGTGYSSLSYLKQLPLDQLKIDQSFVRDISTDPTDAVMVKTIIDLARNFHLDVIAEGVETEAQLAFLQLHGCAAFQGYLFSKPLPASAFEELLQNNNIGIFLR